MTEKKKDFSADDVFPNHLSLQAINFGVDIGSFSLEMVDLKKIALDCLKEMKKLEDD